MTAPLDPATKRILAWDGCYNVRDVGGLPTSSGGRVWTGALVRSDVLCRLTAQGQRSLVDYGVRTIIDVRSAEEVARDWGSYPFREPAVVEAAGRPGVAYRNVPFASGHDERAWEEMLTAYAAAGTRTELNRIDIDANRAGIAAIVAAVADAPEGGVLIHCHAGKDRTGLVVAVLLALVGVGDEHIADDYALTALNLEPLIVEWLDQMSDDALERDRLRELADPRREAMLDSLAHIRTRYGSVEDYVASVGVAPQQIERLHGRLVESAATVRG